MKFLSFIFTALLLFATQLHAHCQIPCGVYDDTMRVKMIEEHTLTILKSMNYIVSNQNDLEQQNQVTRWIMNKSLIQNPTRGIIIARNLFDKE